MHVSYPSYIDTLVPDAGTVTRGQSVSHKQLIKTNIGIRKLFSVSPSNTLHCHGGRAVFQGSS